jgi:hypothetical protein
MRLHKPTAVLASGALLAGATLLAAAGPAAAVDAGPLLDGGIYWFSAVNPLAQQSAATQTTTGAGTVRPWSTLTTQNPCPAGSTSMTSYVRIPQQGLPEDEWVQVPLGMAASDVDADGRFYTKTTVQADRLSKAEVLAYNQANGGSGTFPFLSVCIDGVGNPVGYFRTTVAITGTTNTSISWQIQSPAYAGGGTPQVTATTTTLGATVQGSDLVLTGTVAPAAAGTVAFAEGATSLGSAATSGGAASVTVPAPASGIHTYTATFTPTDTAAYSGSQGSATYTVALDATTGQLQLTVPEAPVVDGTLTFAVPFSSPVALAGSRSGDGSRVTASADFPTVTVTDTRRDGLLTGWQVNAQAQDFAGSAGTIGAKYLGWVPATPSSTKDAGGPLVVQAGATVASALDVAESAGLKSSSPLARTATPGRGTTTLGAKLNLAIPAATAEGQYTSTVTVTLIAD